MYCKRNVAQPFCTDINECDPTNTKMFGTKFCGQNTVCTNTIGSFTCTCNAGYENFTAWEGCVDKDECSPGG
ncbi:MAG: calcium-binding EGF-like domain-containing protein, partial [bacterium]